MRAPAAVVGERCLAPLHSVRLELPRLGMLCCVAVGLLFPSPLSSVELPLLQCIDTSHWMRLPSCVWCSWCNARRAVCVQARGVWPLRAGRFVGATAATRPWPCRYRLRFVPSRWSRRALVFIDGLLVRSWCSAPCLGGWLRGLILVYAGPVIYVPLWVSFATFRSSLGLAASPPFSAVGGVVLCVSFLVFFSGGCWCCPQTFVVWPTGCLPLNLRVLGLACSSSKVRVWRSVQVSKGPLCATVEMR